MQILSIQDRAPVRAPSDYFTGTVWLDQISVATPPSRLRAFRVSFEPGARTAWHSHPYGQVLHILAGIGRVQQAGAPIQTVKPGDTVLIKPGERHWHGAAPDQPMVHLAMQDSSDDGHDAVWFEHVTDKEYSAVAPAEPVVRSDSAHP